MRREKGITLVALIITIIVLVILVGVSIGAMLNSGIIKNTETATTGYNKEQATEIMNLKITNIQVKTYAETQTMPTLTKLAVALDADDEIQYVNTSKTVASINEIDFEAATSIYTKLKAYPYEFEIDSSLRLASIDGVKVAETNPSSGANEQNTMSATEHFTGEYYFNGKPIYAKTFYIESLPNSTNKSYNHGIENVDVIWYDTSNCFAIWNNNDDNIGPLPFSVQSPYIISIEDVNKENFSIATYFDRRQLSAYITLRFTKTTDESNGVTIPATPANS